MGQETNEVGEGKNDVELRVTPLFPKLGLAGSWGNSHEMQHGCGCRIGLGGKGFHFGPEGLESQTRCPTHGETEWGVVSARTAEEVCGFVGNST